jgi:hypothetical protein
MLPFMLPSSTRYAGEMKAAVLDTLGSAIRYLRLRQVVRKRTTAQKRAPYVVASSSGVEWRATVDEDGHYCVAVTP